MANAIIEARVDYRKLAALARAYQLTGRSPKTTGWKRADLLRQIVEEYHDLLLRAGKLEAVETYAEALDIMVSLGYGPMVKRGRGGKSLADAISNEDIDTAIMATEAKDSGKYLSTIDMLKEVEGETNEDSS